MLDDLFIDVFKAFFILNFIIFIIYCYMEHKKEKEVIKNLNLNLKILKDLKNRF